MDKTIYLTRHCEAEHNVNERWHIADANVTPLGRKQAKALNESTKDTIQNEFELIVSSPLRRTMQTTLDGYPKAIERLGGKGKIILVPQAQECNDYPCDTGSPRSELEKDSEFDGRELSASDSLIEYLAEIFHAVDLSPLTDDWTSKAGFYSADVDALKARARYVRQFLRKRPEKKIVLVAHGDILRYIVFGEQNGTPWANAEVRKYKFAKDEDEDAYLVQIETEAKKGREEPTSSRATDDN